MVLLMFCACLSTLCAAELENLLVNPSLEDIKDEDVLWRPGDSNRPDKHAWHVRGTDKGLAEASLDTKDAIDGKQSLYVKVSKDGWVNIEQGWWTGAEHFVLEPDVTYTLSSWMRTSEPGEVSIKLTEWEAPFPNWGTKRVAVKTGWAEYYLTCAPKALSQKPWVEFKLETVKELWFDFAHLYKGEYIPSAGPHSVTSQNKLTIIWGEAKNEK